MKQIMFAKKTNAISALETQNRALSFEASCEAIVLLKNDGSLPLNDKKVALFGAGAKKTIKGGTGSGEVNERYSVSIYSGLLNNGFVITSDKWLDDYDDEYEEKRAIFNHLSLNPLRMFDDVFSQFSYPFGRLINEDDVDIDTRCAIYVASRQAGEGQDKRLDNGDYNLVEEEIANLRFLKDHYQVVILIINSGSGMDLSSIKELNLNAIMYVAGLGLEGGNAVAKVLDGSINPSAKLTDTWPLKYDDIPYGSEYSYLNGDTSKDFYKEDIYVGYKYFDTFKINVRYPFGHGLSYSKYSYEYSNFNVEGSIVSFDCYVKNEGPYEGKKAILAFISMPNGILKKEYKRLIGFEKTKLLNVGEVDILHFSFDLRDAASYFEKEAKYILEKGLYLVWAGEDVNNANIIFGLDLDKAYSPYKLANLVKPNMDFERLVYKKDNEYNIPANLKILDIKNIEEKEVSYDFYKLGNNIEVKSILDNLNVDEKIELCVGLGAKGMIDTKGIYTPGTVGKTTTKLFDKGICNLNLCDGPAGLRILRESALSKRGKLKFIEGNYPIGVMEKLPSFFKKFFLASPKHERYYQYTTAFPVGTALAQTFNKDLCYKVGCAISSEMSEYGITYFLGPALNIHKNPLCGRNFEYFSEDPFVSGLIASSIVKGVESISGNYATIKHFACNNLEDNRQHSSSMVTERALREIYLKGFEICVKNGVKAVMSSYNLINGTYAGNRYDLNMDILRNEWGYNGLVMTDWYETGKNKANDAISIACGIDLIMPGSKGAKKQIKNGLKKGIVSTSDINRACYLIIEQMINSGVYKRYFLEK